MQAPVVTYGHKPCTIGTRLKVFGDEMGREVAVGEFFCNQCQFPLKIDSLLLLILCISKDIGVVVKIIVPFWVPRIIIGIQKGTIILTTTHIIS